MPWDKKNVIEAVKESKNQTEKRKFIQSIDLIINLRDIDPKKPEGKIQEALEAHELCVEDAVKDIVSVGNAMYAGGADGLNIDSVGAAGDADFLAALRATEELKKLHPDICIEIGMAGDTNPTAFRDDCVAMLRRFRPGVLRKLQMGGSTIENTIAPPLESYSFASQPSAKIGPYESHSRDPYSLHEMYELCEHLGCDPWYCLPGTLTREEMERFLEYLAYDSGVGITLADVQANGSSAYDELGLVYKKDTKGNSGKAYPSTPGHFDEPAACDDA